MKHAKQMPKIIWQGEELICLIFKFELKTLSPSKTEFDK